MSHWMLGLVRLISELFLCPRDNPCSTFLYLPWKRRSGSEGTNKRKVTVNLTSTPLRFQIWKELIIIKCTERFKIFQNNSVISDLKAWDRRSGFTGPTFQKYSLWFGSFLWKLSQFIYLIRDLYMYKYVCASKASQLMQAIWVVNQRRPAQTRSCAL